MAENIVNVRVQNKYDTEANWKAKDPVLLNGEQAFTSDGDNINKYKIGNGKSKWSQLAYAKADLSKGDVTTALGYTPPEKDTWRGVQNNLTSDSTTDSLSAAQGKVLKGLIDTHTHKYAGSSSAGGAANSADKLSTKRTIEVTGAASSTPTGFDGTGNIAIPVSGVSESYLTWGGKNFAGSFGPIDAAMIPDLGANRLAFGKPEGVTIEYSRDGGSTWVDYEATENLKKQLFATNSYLYIGKADSNNKATVKYMLRVTIDTDKFHVYTVLNKFAIYISSNGSDGCYCTIDASLESTPTVFKTFADKVIISGWSGWNIINTNNITTYGNVNDKSSQYGLLRFTFGCTSCSTSYVGLQILRIMGFGGVGWSAPSNMARYGTIYSYDEYQNVSFPAKVTATSFDGSLKGNASTATSASKLTTARKINGLAFDGTGDITTTTWGTARNITIGNTKKSVNGSTDIAWTLAEIGAVSSSDLSKYLLKSDIADWAKATKKPSYEISEIGSAPKITESYLIDPDTNEVISTQFEIESDLILSGSVDLSDNITKADIDNLFYF